MVGRAKFDYSGETAIITGSTKGIGRGIAEALIETGANVVVNSRTHEDVEAVADDLDSRGPGRAIGVAADMADPAEVEHLCKRAIETFDTIDLLVNNAAVWPRERSMLDANLEDWDWTMNVNVRSQFYLSKLVANHMIDSGIEGSIINLTSQTGDRRSGRRGLYGVSKTAINGLTWRMAHELAEHGIRMNAISTATTDTYQLRVGAEETATGENETVSDVLERWGQEIPVGRLGVPDDIASAVLFLGSEHASYIVGEILRVSGGGNLQ